MKSIRSLAVALALGVAAVVSAQAEAADITVGFVPGTVSDPFFQAMKKGAQQAADRLGMKLNWQGSSGEYSPQQQLPFVDAMLANNVSVLIFCPTDPDSMQASVTKAQIQGIPVITVDTTVTDQSSVTSFITGDNVAGGRQAAQTLAEQIGNKGKVFIMATSPSATTNTLRRQGFEEEMKNHPDIKIVGIQYSQSQPDRATSAVNTVLLDQPDLAGVFALDGTNTQGAVAAIRNSGKTGKVKLVGYDAYQAEVDALKDGVVTALVAQRPSEEANMAMEFALAKVSGKDTDKIQKNAVIPNVVITKDNLSENEKYVYSE
ncbi:monosaccharide ABC transporter substrate-binding protein, CUT2 family [Faunimonas pinastri]|uniref:Monosaccharide ABC transporter substrate-binding protein, CUT2 family n=1 Tax=Faunimonas pinastri TaxID=1855383 RepID=A0A1H9D944_9HYPH|nr:ABC transporter substrate-binding protein [Faunimonas pinastri]SEQ09383.1 monosaccharide ABC transporter substrate-binding protein, CUT2 family [Faunimonas pinastri]